jgi:uncharacterized protein (DUF58 family)
MDSQERIPSLFILPFSLFFVGLFLLIALLNGQTDLAILCFLILGMAGGAKLWTRKSLAGIKCQATVDRTRVFPGEVVRLKTMIKNGKFLPVWFQIVTSAEGLQPPSMQEKDLRKGARLLWNQRVLFDWDLEARKRGVYQLGPFRLQAGDLFGFYSSEKPAGETISVIVYPRLVFLKSFPLPRQDLFGLPGAKSPVQDPIYVHGTHDYQSWQPAKYIHWKASARHTRLQSKVFEPSAQEKLLLAVQVDQFAEKKKETEFEQTLEAVASLAVSLDRKGYAVGLVTNGFIKGEGRGIIPVARHPQQLAMILETLARLEMRVKRDFIDTLREGPIRLGNMSCVCFVYEEDQGIEKIRDYFSYHRTALKNIACVPGSARVERGQGAHHRTHLLEEIRVG